MPLIANLDQAVRGCFCVEERRLHKRPRVPACVVRSSSHALRQSSEGHICYTRWELFPGQSSTSTLPQRSPR
jgi:hypothetical protein